MPKFPSLHLTAFALASISLLTSCLGHRRDRRERTIIGTGNVVTISRGVHGFTGIHLAGIGKLILRQASKENVTVTADDNVEPAMVAEIDNGILTLRTKNDVKINSKVGIVWRVTVTDIDSIRTDGIVSVEGSGIDTNYLFIDMDGVSTLKMSGTVDHQDLQVSGVVTYDGLDFESHETGLTGDGVLSMSLAVSEKLMGRVCGAGTVTYRGDPKNTLDACPLVTVRRR